VRRLACALCLWLTLPVCQGVAAAEESSESDEEFVEEEQAAPETFSGFVQHYFVEDNPDTNRAVASIASLLLPGAGQLINQEYLKGLTHVSFFAANELAYRSYEINEDRRNYAESRDDQYIYASDDSVRRNLLGSWALSTRFYSSFDAYRASSVIMKRAGGDTPISQESFSELALAPFTPRHFTRPLVFTPLFLLGAYSLGRGSAHRQDDDFKRFILDDEEKNNVAIFGAMEYEGVAIGEEAFFRGLLNTELIRATGVYPGIFFSSILFGFAHSGKGLTANASIASLYGFYLGYMHHNYDYQLGPGVALHFWWNTIIHASIASRSREYTVPLAYFTF